jgi:hypothetical protein
MKELTERLLGATKKKLFRTKPIYETRGLASDEELLSFESQHGIQFSKDLRYWLLNAGFGEFRDEILIDPCWFNVIEEGDAKGHFIFAQDGLGNFYSFPTGGESIHFHSRKTPEWTEVAETFQQFLEELEQRGFEICDWSMALDLQPCGRPEN